MDDIERVLPVKLTAAELAERGELLAQEYEGYCEVEAKKKAANEQFKEQLDAHRKEMRVLSHQIASRHVPRRVKCRWIEDFAHNVRRLVRQDSGEVIDEQAISADDRQTSLLS